MSTRRLFIAWGVVLSFAMASARPACAQRTAYGGRFVSVEPMVTAYCVPSAGLDLNYGGYRSASYWRTGVRLADWNHRIDTGGDVSAVTSSSASDGADKAASANGPMFDHVQASVYGGWRWRLVSTYSRVFSIYAGADAFVGINKLQVLRKLDEEMTVPAPDEEFAYGTVPEIEMELFLGRRVALLLGVQCPVTLGTSLQTDTWNLTGTVGLRFNLRRR